MSLLWTVFGQKITGGGIKLTSHIKTRNTLKDIPLVETFEALLNKSMISDEEKELMRLHYIQKKDFRFIGDTYCSIRYHLFYRWYFYLYNFSCTFSTL